MCTPETFRLTWAWEISLSKSIVERRPLMMKSAPISAATSTTSLAKLITSMLSRWVSDSRIISSRSSRVNSGSPFCGLRIVATTTSSKRWLAVSISSTCPLWIGSNDPGYSTLVIGMHATAGAWAWLPPGRSDGDALGDHDVGAAVALRPHDLPAEGRLDRPVRLQHRGLRGQVEQQLGPAVVVVGRVEEGQVPPPLLGAGQEALDRRGDDVGGAGEAAGGQVRLDRPSAPRCPGRRRWPGRRRVTAPRCPWPRSRRTGRAPRPPPPRRGSRGR